MHNTFCIRFLYHFFSSENYWFNDIWLLSVLITHTVDTDKFMLHNTYVSVLILMIVLLKYHIDGKVQDYGISSVSKGNATVLCEAINICISSYAYFFLHSKCLDSVYDDVWLMGDLVFIQPVKNSSDTSAWGVPPMIHCKLKVILQISYSMIYTSMIIVWFVFHCKKCTFYIIHFVMLIINILVYYIIYFNINNQGQKAVHHIFVIH